MPVSAELKLQSGISELELKKMVKEAKVRREKKGNDDDEEDDDDEEEAEMVNDKTKEEGELDIQKNDKVNEKDQEVAVDKSDSTEIKATKRPISNTDPVKKKKMDSDQ